MCKLGRRDLVFCANLGEFLCWDQGGCGHVAWSAFARHLEICVRVWVDVDVLVEEGVIEIVVIRRVAEDVEGFVGVLDG